MEILIILGVIILITVMVIIVRSDTSAHKGYRGEALVGRILGETISGQQYVINDYMMEADGKTHQIDHIYISQNGIYVIETKNYSGNVYGSDKQREWTQVLAYGNVKNKFYNPVKQNATHIYCISKLLKNVQVNSIIVFTQSNIENIQSNYVITPSQLKGYIRNPATSAQQLTAEQMEIINDTLLRNRSSKTLTEHVENINKMQDDIKNNVCPRCNGKLVIRKGKSGEFYGCSNYPYCKFTKHKTIQ